MMIKNKICFCIILVLLVIYTLLGVKSLQYKEHSENMQYAMCNNSNGVVVYYKERHRDYCVHGGNFVEIIVK